MLQCGLSSLGPVLAASFLGVAHASTLATAIVILLFLLMITLLMLKVHVYFMIYDASYLHVMVQYIYMVFAYMAPFHYIYLNLIGHMSDFYDWLTIYMYLQLYILWLNYMHVDIQYTDYNQTLYGMQFEIISFFLRERKN